MGRVSFYRSGVSKHFTTLSLSPESIISDFVSTPVCECCVAAILSMCLHGFVNIFLDTSTDFVTCRSRNGSL